MPRCWALLFLSLFCSCATQTPLSEQLKRNTISAGSVLDLAKTSYLRGCVEARVEIFGKTKGRNLKHCQQKSKKHVSEIKKILIGIDQD
jgi:hypothetical protein